MENKDHLARANDPATSHLAADRLVASGQFKTDMERAVYYVEKYPGRTAQELSALAGDKESGRIRKRLNDAENRGLIIRGEPRECSVSGTHALAQTYYPADPNVAVPPEEQEYRSLKDRIRRLVTDNPEFADVTLIDLLDRTPGTALRKVLNRLQKRCRGKVFADEPGRARFDAINRGIDALP